MEVTVVKVIIPRTRFSAKPAAELAICSSDARQGSDFLGVMTQGPALEAAKETKGPFLGTFWAQCRKVWVSIKFLSVKFGFAPPPARKRPKMRKNCTNQYKTPSRLTLFRGGVWNAILWTKRFYGHLGVSDQFWANPRGPKWLQVA